MVNSLVVRARGLEYGGREFESRSLHLKPETKLKKEKKLLDLWISVRHHEVVVGVAQCIDC